MSMTCWQIHERGSEGGVWRLTQHEKLTIGRNKENHIVLTSQSVDGNHAVVEWSSRHDAFVVQDLSSVNGTFLNNQPVRRVTALYHGDSLRFGYEKSRVFRIEEVQSPTQPLCPTPASSVTTQTSPQAPPTFATPTPAPSQGAPMATLSPQHVVMNNVQQTPPMAAFGGVQPQPQMVGGMQYIPVTGHYQQPLMYPAGQSPLHMPYIITQYGYPSPNTPISIPSPVVMPAPAGSSLPPSPTITLSPQVLMSPQPSPPTTPMTPQSQFQAPPTSVTRQSQSLPSTPTASSYQLSVEDIEVANISEKGGSRNDGRRSVEISSSPLLSSTSKLYGKPSWWGEEEKGDEESKNHAFQIVKPGSPQILRDLEPSRSQEDDSNSVSSSAKSGVRLSAKDELRMQAISNSISQDRDQTSTWVIDFGSGGSGTSAKKPPRHHRPRSADPSPSRGTPHRIRDVSPAAHASRRSISPAARMTASLSSPGSSPTHPVRTTKKKKEGDTVSSKKPPSAPIIRSKTMRVNPKVQKSDPRRRSLEGLKSDSKTPPITKKLTSSATVRKPKKTTKAAGAKQNETYTIATKSQDTKNKTCIKNGIGTPTDSKNENGTSTNSKNETYVTAEQGTGEQSQSSVSDQSEVVASETREERPSSARKQWSNEQPQAPDSLMLASIEARMRRLSKMAHAVAIHVSSLKQSLLEVGVVTEEGYTCFEPFASSSAAKEQELPKWKFFNKEGDSIFRSVRATEKWLKDIDNTVKSLRPVGVAKSGGSEEVDQGLVEVDSEGEYFLDSIDDLSCASDDTYNISKSSDF